MTSTEEIYHDAFTEERAKRRELEARLRAVEQERQALRDELSARGFYWEWNPKTLAATCYRLRDGAQQPKEPQ